MSTPTVQAGQACQEFNRLIDYISSAPEDNSASANAALLAISKLPLVREVMKELELGVEGSMVIESNNAVSPLVGLEFPWNLSLTGPHSSRPAFEASTACLIV